VHLPSEIVLKDILLGAGQDSSKWILLSLKSIVMCQTRGVEEKAGKRDFERLIKSIT
jgi:hypothetical protein